LSAAINHNIQAASDWTFLTLGYLRYDTLKIIFDNSNQQHVRQLDASHANHLSIVSGTRLKDGQGA
jgi:hypothetical protein